MSVNKIYNIQEWQRVISTATPSFGNEIIYPKTDGNWYHKGSDGIEKIMSLSYNVGNGLTVSATSSMYNYILSVNIDGVSLTSNSGVLTIGTLTASKLSLTTATAGYILSVDANGNTNWIANNNIGFYGNNNYVSKYTGLNTLTNSNIYDSNTSINLFTSSNSVVGSAKLFVNGAIDTSALYLSSSLFTYFISNTSKITAKSSGFNISDTSITYLDSNKDLVNGNNFNILDSLVRITGTGSANSTASVVTNNTYIGIGTASPSHALHIFGITSSFRLADGSQGVNKILSSDANGVATWILSSNLPFNFAENSGLTNSNGFTILLDSNSGLTISNNRLSINPSIAGSGLAYSGGSMSIISAPGTFGTGKGLTNSGYTFSVDINPFSGLTFSGNRLSIDPSIAGTGLLYSGGSMSVSSIPANITGTTNSIPYFNTSNSLTASSLLQINNNILIATFSDNGSRLQINGSFSSTNDGIINGANIGRGSSSTNIRFGYNSLAAISAGNYNIGIGDNTLLINQSNYNIAIGYNSLSNNSTGFDNISIGVSSMLNSTTGNSSVSIGKLAGLYLVSNSVSVGANSGRGGSYNVAIGASAGGNNLSNYNTFIGYNSGINYSGTGSVFVGGFGTTGIYTYLNNATSSVFLSDGYGNLRMYIPSTGNILLGTMSDNGSLLQISGSMSIISTKANAFQLKDGSQGANKILTSDANGYATWATYSNIAYKYGVTYSFIGSTPVLFTHNLNTKFYTIQLFDYITGEEIFGEYSLRNINDVTITVTQNISNCGIIIVG